MSVRVCMYGERYQQPDDSSPGGPYGVVSGSCDVWTASDSEHRINAVVSETNAKIIGERARFEAAIIGVRSECKESIQGLSSALTAQIANSLSSEKLDSVVSAKLEDFVDAVIRKLQERGLIV